mmetsp:Transcript_21930/g.65751  ORF Transcript_21930/g.65751 Transcript_21930/m.65751 type:complete len:283 (+) Transcript_21930:346-1194(+)
MRRKNAGPRERFATAAKHSFERLERTASWENVKAEVAKAEAKVKVILDRDAHWTSLGYDPEVKKKTVRWCWIVLISLSLALVAVSRTFDAPAAPVAFSYLRCAATAGLFWAAGFALVTDSYRNPPPEKGSASHTCSRYLGPYGFFTKQALTIQVAHLAVSSLAETLADPQLLALSHAFAAFAASVGIALTLLYLKLNWFEPTWQKEVLEATNARGIDFTSITLTAHIPSLPIALLDVGLVKRPEVYPLSQTSVLRSAGTLTFYCFFYCALTKFNYWLVGEYP